MADVVDAAPIQITTTTSAERGFWRRADTWVAITALVASMLALPLAQSAWNGPEVASVLAVAATAMLAGQRWAIAIVALAELLLAPTVAEHAFSGGLALWPDKICSLVALLATVPGLLALRRAAAAMLLVTGLPRTQVMHRRLQAALIVVGALAVLIGLL